MKKIITPIVAFSVLLAGCATLDVQSLRGVASALKASPETLTLQTDWDACIESVVPEVRITGGERLGGALFYPVGIYHGVQYRTRAREALAECMRRKGYAVQDAAYEEEQVPKIRRDR